MVNSLRATLSKAAKHTFYGCVFAFLVGCQGFTSEEPPHLGEIPNQGIFGGNSVVDMDSVAARHVVGIRFLGNNGTMQTCTGAWIHDNWIVTAAHCLPPTKKDIQIFQTVDLMWGGNKALDVLQMIPHPEAQKTKMLLAQTKDYATGNRHDIALIEVAFPLFPHEVFILPGMSTSPQLMATSKRILNLKISGFGAEDVDVLLGTSKTTSTLQETILAVANQADNGVVYAEQKGTTGICLGDSGAPLYGKMRQKNLLVAIASSVRNPGSSSVCHGESRFVQISPHIDWINSVIH